MARILVTSDIYSESQYFVDEIPKANQFQISSDFKNMPGSKMLNAARVLHALGNNVEIRGLVGDDQEGALMLEKIKAWGFNIDNIQKKEGEKTGHIVVITDKSGNSSVTLYQGVNTQLTPDNIFPHKTDLHQYDFVYTGTHLPLGTLYEIVERCNLEKVKVFIDFPNKQKEVDLTRLENADYIVPNRQEAELMLGIRIHDIEDAKKALNLLRERIDGTIIITLDKEGCITFEKGKTDPKYYETTLVNGGDATGSGDIFRAKLVSELAKGIELDIAIKNSLKLATESVKIVGVDETLKSLDYKSSW
ncbi:bifunctional hydroxymethylpyrimidine kinase/phosphomethylpyrimidine kinase [Candidatus Dojkabacteria bacterium]|nr:bifunctional hydroxymethylpyrimidine kinase/phosphomethylpyrimidine kinase [Candidatus Dojkabacteria bacterium]